MYDHEFNYNEEKLIKLFVEAVRPDLTAKVVRSAIIKSNIDPSDAIEWIAEQIEAKENISGGLNL